MSERFRRAVQLLLHIEDTPHRTALAFGVGVLIAFSPFLGIHFGIALLVAFLFRLNRVAILFGTYLNNPWTLAPIYLAGTSLGCLLLGVSSDGLDSDRLGADRAGVPARRSGRRCGRTCGRSSSGTRCWAPPAGWSATSCCAASSSGAPRAAAARPES